MFYDEKPTATIGELRKCKCLETMTHFQWPQLLTNIILEIYMRSLFIRLSKEFRYLADFQSKNNQIYIKLLLLKKLFIWVETSHLGETFPLSEIFILCLHEKNIPPECDTFHPNNPAFLFLSTYSYFYFHYLLIFLFFFNFR